MQQTMRDVLIVGGGIIGLCSALELKRRGREVLVLDAGPAVPPASWAGGGILSPLFPWRYPEPVTRLTSDAVARYRALAAEIHACGGDTELDECGLLVAVPDDRERAAQWARENGISMRTVPADEVQQGLAFECGLYFPGLGAIRNPGLLEGIERLLVQRGVEIRRESVSGLALRQSGVSVTTGRDRYEAGQVLVAAGQASSALLYHLGLSLPLFPVKGQMLMYRGRPGGLKTVVLTENGYLIPRRDGRVLAGSTLEPGEDSVAPTRQAGEALHARALALWPALEGCPLEAQWAGVRPGCHGDIPWIGALPECPGVWVATGHYRNGLVAAPATAELVAQMICGEPTRLDPAPFNLARDIQTFPVGG